MTPPTFGQFWEMATAANLQIRGRSLPSDAPDYQIMIEMIAMPRTGDRTGDIVARMTRAIEWIIANGGVCDPAVQDRSKLTFRGAICGVRFAILIHDHHLQKKA